MTSYHRKYGFQLLMLIGMARFCSGQTVAVENVHTNFAFPWKSCHLIITAEQVPCSSIYVNTNNGRILKEADCKYDFTADKVGDATIFIYRIARKDTVLIGQRKYWIKKWPKHYAQLANKSSGKIKHAMLRVVLGPHVPISAFDISGLIELLPGYRVIISRGDSLMCNIKNEDILFKEPVRACIAAAQKGDRIILTDLLVKMPGESEATKLDDIQLEIE